MYTVGDTFLRMGNGPDGCTPLELSGNRLMQVQRKVLYSAPGYVAAACSCPSTCVREVCTELGLQGEVDSKSKL
jgi:hypothetical protein